MQVREGSVHRGRIISNIINLLEHLSFDLLLFQDGMFLMRNAIQRSNQSQAVAPPPSLSLLVSSGGTASLPPFLLIPPCSFFLVILAPFLSLHSLFFPPSLILLSPADRASPRLDARGPRPGRLCRRRSAARQGACHGRAASSWTAP
jgi:hypothetical protein